MHSDRITVWNNDIYKNVKKDRNKYIQEEKDEDRVVNIVGFTEMLVEMENSPFVFSFEPGTGRLLVQNTFVKADNPSLATSGSGKAMLKQWLLNKLNDKYSVFERNSDKTYGGGGG